VEGETEEEMRRRLAAQWWSNTAHPLKNGGALHTVEGNFGIFGISGRKQIAGV